MSFTLKGTLTNTTTTTTTPATPLSAYSVKLFDKDPPFDVFGDDPLGSAITLDDGTFRIDFTKEDFRRPNEFWESVLNEPDLYAKIFDPEGNLIHETGVISSSNPFVSYNNPNEKDQCEAVVIISRKPI
jgi:hypothetical protein